MLAAHEREALAHLKQHVLDPGQQAALKIALVSVSGQGQEVEMIGVLQDLLGHVGMGWRQCAAEVGDCLSLALAQPGLDLCGKDRTAPAMLQRRLGIPEPGGRVAGYGCGASGAGARKPGA
jgi:hypothetical protein